MAMTFSMHVLMISSLAEILLFFPEEEDVGEDREDLSSGVTVAFMTSSRISMGIVLNLDD
jgi:hypothetical protein